MSTRPCTFSALIILLLSACNPTGQTTIGQNFYPGVLFSNSNSSVTVSNPQVASGNSIDVTVFLKDTNGAPFVSTLQTVTVQTAGGTSTGILSDVKNNGDGSYSMTFTGVTTGTATTIRALVNGTLLSGSFPSVIVTAGNYSLSNSIVGVSSNTVASGSSITATLTVKDASGNPLSSGGLNVSFSYGGGTSTGVFGAVTDHGNGTYTALFTGGIGGTFVTINATINGNAVVGASPPVTVSGGIPSVIAVSSGNGQSASAGSLLGSPLVAIVKDSVNNPMAGVNVTWAVTAGGGTISSCMTTTDAFGLAQCTLTTGTAAGINTVTASGGGIAIPATFMETGNAGPLASVAFTTGPVSVTTTDATQTVMITEYDSHGNILISDTGTPITLAGYSTANCSGSAVGSSLSATSSNTSSGVSTFSSFKILKTSIQSILATDGSKTVCASGLTISAGAAANITATSGSSQSANDGTALTSPLIATVSDAQGNAVSGITINWSVTAGNGTRSSCTTSTNASGQVQCSYTMGLGSPGTNTITATIQGTSTLATFTETGTAAGFSSSWNFQTSSQYSYDISKVDFLNNYAELTPASQTDNSNNAIGFGGGTLTGTTWDGTNDYIRLSHTGTPTNNAELDSSWAPEWANLVGYWKFDEGASATTFVDSSSKGNGGTIIGTVTSGVSGHLSNAAIFGGGIATIGQSRVYIAAANQPITISTWVNPSSISSSTAANNRILNFHYSPASSNLVLALDSTNSVVYYNSADTSYNRWANKIQTGVWTHIVLVYNGTCFQMYFNGIADGTCVAKSLTAGSGDNGTIGGYISGTDSFLGSIDETAIWNTSLSSAEIQTIYSRQSAAYAGTFQSRVIDGLTSGQSWTSLAWTSTLPFFKELPDNSTTTPVSETSSSYASQTSSLMSGIVGLWHLDEPIGTTGANSVIDNSGNGFNGTPSSYNTFGSAGIFGGSSVFSGNGSINLGTALLANKMTGSTGITVATWAKYTTLSTTGIYDNGLMSIITDSTNRGLYLGIRGDSGNIGKVIVGSRSSPSDALQLKTSSAALNAGQWYHLVGVIDFTGKTITLAINGVPVTSSGLSFANNTFAPGTPTTTDGIIAGNFSAFTGNIDEVAVWSRALSSAEILELYRRGANRTKYQVRSCPDSMCSTNPTWLGPDGTNQTYFSEVNNNSVQSAGGDVTSGDSVQTSAPTMTFANFGAPLTTNLTANRYFQYRAIMESDDTGTSCNYGPGFTATWCSPELQKVIGGPNHYDTSSPSVTNNAGVAYVTLTNLIETLASGGCSSGTLYNLSPDNSHWYYWTGAAWGVADGTTSEANSASTIASHLSSYATQEGTGMTYFKIFLQSSGSSSCAISNLEIDGTD